jgi:hypothetical protein
LIWTTEVNFNKPKPSEGFIPLTSGIRIAHCSADFELLTKQGFVFLKLVLPQLKFDHLLPGLCIYTGMEGHCLLHRRHLGPSSSFQGLGFGLPNSSSEQDGLVAQMNSEIVKGVIGLSFTKRHLQWNQVLGHATSASINPKVGWQRDYSELGRLCPCIRCLGEIRWVIIEIIENVYIQVVRVIICIKPLPEMGKSRMSEAIYLSLETISLPGNV